MLLVGLLLACSPGRQLQLWNSQLVPEIYCAAHVDLLLIADVPSEARLAVRPKRTNSKGVQVTCVIANV